MRLKQLLRLSLIFLIAGCAPPLKGQPLDLASVNRDYVTTAESVTSLIANELGNVSGPPTPGALSFKNCVQSSCTASHDGSGLNALHFKQARSCPTNSGSLDGAIFMRLENTSDFLGCATSAGPLTFRQWPPAGGKITFAIGNQGLLSSGVSTDAPAKTLNRNETERGLGKYWGTASLAFNGTNDAEVELDQWLQFAGAEHETRYHFQTAVALKLHLESPWDSEARVFTGTCAMTDAIRKTTNTVQLDNVAYRKKHCCHPVSGTLALSCQATSVPKDGVQMFILEFTESCGEAVLHDGFGASSRLKLPDCAS